MFTLEIGGRPIAVIDTDEEDARELVDSAPFRDDLKRLLSEDKPIWDGQAALTVRAATEEEIAEFEASDEGEEDDFADAADEEEDEDEDEDDDAAVVLFLIPITDPDDDSEEDEEA
ncbi:hypothetical protein BKE38_14260 [Pseudoroseomonas deserti]|uniref:Glutamine amidotransferase n=1 Tax=Teichococcus deserti TaxID=1817963 RepID=A0A1V2H172_9PROT|nr:hypothetical protein [Pseudoroseomonas deserti]ONG52577.1 hypothetical protein BKE38_14260 [Pseudoroseomonas deserti]